LLREQGCDEMQGFYFSRPVRAEILGALLAERKHGLRNGARAQRNVTSPSAGLRAGSPKGV
jgi:predicted signal transduction protein with EAL and GGDEF domain